MKKTEKQPQKYKKKKKKKKKEKKKNVENNVESTERSDAQNIRKRLNKIYVLYLFALDSIVIGRPTLAGILKAIIQPRLRKAILICFFHMKEEEEKEEGKN